MLFCDVIGPGGRESGCTMKFRRAMTAVGVTTGCFFGGIGALALDTPAGAQQNAPIEECLGQIVGSNTPDCVLIEQSTPTEVNLGAFLIPGGIGPAYGASVSCGGGTFAFDIAIGGGLGEGIPVSPLCDL